MADYDPVKFKAYKAQIKAERAYKRPTVYADRELSSGSLNPWCRMAGAILLQAAREATGNIQGSVFWQMKELPQAARREYISDKRRKATYWLLSEEAVFYSQFAEGFDYAECRRFALKRVEIMERSEHACQNALFYIGREKE